MNRADGGVAPRATCRVVGLALASIAALGSAGAVDAQQGPPDPLPPRPFSEPRMVIGGLQNGARLLISSSGESPLVTVDVILPGGQGSDPDGLEGLSLLTAALLKSGTTTRSFDEIVAELDQLGASLTATADADFTRVSLIALSDAIEPALEIMAEVISRPTFPEDRVAALKQQALGALAAQRAQAGTLARRVMVRELYREHPYGKQTTEATIGAISRENLVVHHDRWFRPGGGVVVVTGDTSVRPATQLLNRVFADWTGESAGASDPMSHPTQDGGIVLVHRPGSVQAEVRIGHVLPTGDSPDWRALDVAIHHLGAGPSGLLFRELRERLGFTYSATANAERRTGPGLLEVAFAARSEVAADALGEALRLMEEVATRPMAEEDLSAAVDFLTGVLPLQNETPQQAVTRLANGLVRGWEDLGFDPILRELRALTAGEVRRAFADAVDPSRADIVVVGDAVVLQPQLAIYGDVRVELPDGTPLSMAELAPSGRSAPLSAVRLPMDSYRYDVTLQGQSVGSLMREFEGDEAERTATSLLALGAATTTQSVTFTTQDFRFLASTIRIEQGAARLQGDVRLEGDRIRGTLNAGQGPVQIDLAVPPGVLVADMLELAVWVADLEVGTELRVPVASVSAGTVSNAVIRVEERTSITVPAGTFDVFRVEVEGAERQTLWVRTDAPHIVVRVAPGDQPIVVELVAVEPAVPQGG